MSRVSEMDRTDKTITGIKLQELVKEVDVLNPVKMPSTMITGLTADSRRAADGTLFVAIAGQTVDGHDYVREAVRRGCTAVLVNKGFCRRLKLDQQVACLETASTQEALGKVAAAFCRHPAAEMVMIGITGTNGKTTTTYLLESIIRGNGGNPGVIGTVNYRYNHKELQAPFTTPDAISLQQLLREMADGGVSHVIMEVSSHSIEQQRIGGMRFDVALFTNLTRDHLDFHGDMENYFVTKKKLFVDYLKPDGKAVVVVDGKEQEPWGPRLLRELAKKDSGGGRLISCGKTGSNVVVHPIDESIAGTVAEFDAPQGKILVKSRMVGEFNLKNMLGAVGVAAALGISREKVAEGLAVAQDAPGRLQKVGSVAGINVFVDYAHTPDALANVLATLRKLTRKRLIVIFGCGGDRDRGKRAIMGKIAGQLADVVVLTSDNPRSESAEAILAEIESGIQAHALPRMRVETLLGAGFQGYDVVVDRREAIRTTIRHAGVGDVVAICGKGHETYQIDRQGKRFFDDRLEAARLAAEQSW